MFLTYTPNGGESQEFEIDPEDFRLDEIAEIERYSGKVFHKFIEGLGTESVGDFRPLLYVYLRRDNVLVKYRDVNPRISEIGFRQSRAELLSTRASVEGQTGNPLREHMLAVIDEQLADLAADADPGKAESPASSISASGNRASRRRGKSTA